MARLDPLDHLPVAPSRDEFRAATVRSGRESGRELWFHVAGTPAPQGSKNVIPLSSKGEPVLDAKGRQRVVVKESSAGVRPWRADVRAAAILAAQEQWGSVWEPLGGPIVAHIVFSMRRPLGAPKTRRTVPSTTPDLSKLLRSTEDALIEARVIADDARIVEYLRLAKVYAGDPYDRDSLNFTGAVIRLWPYPADYLGAAAPL